MAKKPSYHQDIQADRRQELHRRERKGTKTDKYIFCDLRKAKEATEKPSIENYGYFFENSEFWFWQKNFVKPGK